MNPLQALWDYQQAEFSLVKLTKEMRSTTAYRKCVKLKKIVHDHRANLDTMENALKVHTNKIDEYSSMYVQLSRNYELEKSDLEIMENDEESTAEELSEARKSIEKLHARINALAKELNATIRWVETTTNDINTVWVKAAKANQDYIAAKAVCEEEREGFAPKIADAQVQVDKKKADVPEELMEKYLTLKKNFPLPVAKVNSGMCGGCNMMLSSIVVKKVAAGNEIVECENCGRILIQ